MKLIFVFLLSGVVNVNATAIAQTITLSRRNISIETIFKEVKKQTQFNLICDIAVIRETPPMDIHVTKKPLQKFLDEVLNSRNLTYIITDKTIVVRKKPSGSPSMAGGYSSSRQPRQVSGKVTDESGVPLLGVSVQVKGGNQGTTTDDDGAFRLAIGDTGSTLIFTLLGYEVEERQITSADRITVILKPVVSDLEEVVVVGYGTQKKGNLTGSVDVVSGERLANRPANTVADLVKGVSPNLNISMNLRGGEPGSVSSWNLRGIASINGGGAPLILVDGVEMNITNVDPESIESISVLKDASASAVYGSRAPFGVVLITTKRGRKDGVVNIQYSDNLSFSSPIRLPSHIDSYTWATVYNQAQANAGLAPLYSDEQVERIQGYIDGTFPYEYDPENPIDNVFAGRRNGNANNNWARLLFRDYAFNQKHNINVSGGTEKTQYYVSGGYIEQNGIYQWGNDSYKRYNFITNFHSAVTPWLRFNSSVKYASGKTDYPMGETTVGREHTFREILFFAPMMPFHNINGTVQSPLVRLLQDSGRDIGHTGDFFLTLGGELEPVKGWKTTFSYNYNNVGRRATSNPGPVPVELGTGEIGNIGKPEASYNTSFSQNIYTLINGTSSYENEFDGHYVKALVGYEQEYRYTTGLNATGAGLISDRVVSLSTALGGKTVGDDISHWATQGVFGRLNYNYDEKYLLEVSARYNGSSRFANDHRWGFFPSASVGYAISREDFWRPLSPYINDLKVRLSYGSLGNQNVANYLYLPTIPIGSELNWIIDNERPGYANVPGLLSDNLTWETITTLNIGLDARLLKNRLSVTFDWYNRVTTDMLGPAITLPYPLGATTPYANNAELSTKGYELVVSWEDRPSESFSYHASVSLGDNRSTILKYLNEKELINTWYVGKRVGELWGYLSDGLIQEVNEPMPDQSYFYATWGPGDMKYRDVNGDGAVNPGQNTLSDHGDLVRIGNDQPRYNAGITGGVQWKQFDFSMFWQGVGKRDYLPQTGSAVFWGTIDAWAGSGLFRDSYNLDYWRPADETNILGPNTDAYLPKPYFSVETNKNRQPQDRYVLNASYLRLKNLQVGYTLPARLLDNYHMGNVRIYFSGENLLTITKLPKVFDPETVFASDTRYGGYLTSGVIYPIQRSLSLGLNITF